MNNRSSLLSVLALCVFAVAGVVGLSVYGTPWLLAAIAVGGIVATLAPYLLATRHRFTPVVMAVLTLGLWLVSATTFLAKAGQYELALLTGVVALLPLWVSVNLLLSLAEQANVQAGLFSLDPEVNEQARNRLQSYTADIAAARTPAGILWRYFARRDAAKAKAKAENDAA